ncbi:hypothetical protein QUA31_28110 [Microcoleus sp. Pol14D5]|uniref:hypothetical protein n=1 Tax=unclassified Microcoleus TaxID=2642155 RepID=UPI002FD57EC8
MKMWNEEGKRGDLYLLSLHGNSPIYTLIMQRPHLLGRLTAIALHSVLPDFAGNCGAIALLTVMLSRLIVKNC